MVFVKHVHENKTYFQSFVKKCMHVNIMLYRPMTIFRQSIIRSSFTLGPTLYSFIVQSRFYIAVRLILAIGNNIQNET